MNPSEEDLQKATWIVGSPTNMMGLALILGTENQTDYYVAVHVRPDERQKLVASRGFVTKTDCIADVIRQVREKYECDILLLNERAHVQDFLGILAQAYANECARQEQEKVQKTPVKPSFWQNILKYFSSL